MRYWNGLQSILSFISLMGILAIICTTPGVCYPLCSGFELKHGRLSGDEDVKVKPMEMSPNLNLNISPLLYV
jgi:hypothetical protein